MESGISNEGLVSVIMIFLDEEHFLEEAIESVLGQHYNRWELLLVDDGSTDRSSEMAQSYARRFPEQVRYLEHPGHENRGTSASRNLGLCHARGEYVAFLDGDDMWLPEKLEQQVKLMESHPEAAMVFGPTLMWYSWTGTLEDQKRDYRRRLGMRADRMIEPPYLLTCALQQQTEPPAMCNVLVRRDVVEALGGFDEAFRDLYEDQALYAKIFLAERVYVTSGYWSRYRQHPASTCAVAMREGTYHDEMPHPMRLYFLQWLEAYLREKKIDNAKIWRLLRRELWLYRHPVLHHWLRRVQMVCNKVKGGLLLHGTAFLFEVGRRVLPVHLRQWLWEQGSRTQTEQAR